jgi:hypothetical protein
MTMVRIGIVGIGFMGITHYPGMMSSQVFIKP